jgi:uncharacterized protein (DUF2267 family)
MEYERFRETVRERAGLAAEEAPEDVLAAVLVTLSERLPDDECRDLAEQLPHEVGESMTAADGSTSFGYGEFVTRVAEREERVGNADRGRVERHAAAVVAVLLEAVTARESDDVLSYLTPDYEPLFDMVDPESVWGPGWYDRLAEQR